MTGSVTRAASRAADIEALIPEVPGNAANVAMLEGNAESEKAVTNGPLSTEGCDQPTALTAEEDIKYGVLGCNPVITAETELLPIKDDVPAGESAVQRAAMLLEAIINEEAVPIKGGNTADAECPKRDWDVIAKLAPVVTVEFVHAAVAASSDGPPAKLMVEIMPGNAASTATESFNDSNGKPPTLRGSGI